MESIHRYILGIGRGGRVVHKRILDTDSRTHLGHAGRPGLPTRLPSMNVLCLLEVWTVQHAGTLHLVQVVQIDGGAPGFWRPKGCLGCPSPPWSLHPAQSPTSRQVTGPPGQNSRGIWSGSFMNLGDRGVRPYYRLLQGGGND